MAIAPEPRRTLYLIAALSGYRRNELSRMEGQDFAPHGAKPCWRLCADRSKNGRCDVVPIVPDLLPTVRGIALRMRPSGSLFRDGLGMRCAPYLETFYADLDRASIPRIDDYGRYADFHSLRYAFCRFMAEVLPMEIVKVLMRHATITLTIDLYGKLGIKDLGVRMKMIPPVFRAD